LSSPWHPSTVACAMSASTNTGFPVCCTPAPRSNAGGGNTTRSDRRGRWAGWHRPSKN